MLSVLIGLAYVGGAAEHPGGGAAGIGIGCVENGRPLMDRRDDRLVGILLDIAALDDGIFADEIGRNMRRDRDCDFGHFQNAILPFECSASFMLHLCRRTDPEPTAQKSRKGNTTQAPTYQK